MPEGNTPNSSRMVTITAINKLGINQTSKTIELSTSDLSPLGEKDLTKIHVKDENGKEMICQTVDTDGDYYPEQLIFQADFDAEQTRTFTAFAGDKRVYEKDQFRAYGRFVRVRCDDFCWENDRIVIRIYEKSLETCVLYPLTSSTVDVWSKRTTRLVINDWYMIDNYHGDNGDGGDFYTAGLSRGCGGNGLWTADKLWVSKNFIDSRPLTNGPIRIMFELTYEPFEVNGKMVSEVKRISLDAGHNLTHFQSSYKTKTDSNVNLVCGAGLKKVEGEQVEVNEEYGWLSFVAIISFSFISMLISMVLIFLNMGKNRRRMIAFIISSIIFFIITILPALIFTLYILSTARIDYQPVEEIEGDKIKTIETPGVASDIFVYENYGYIADGTSGLQIIDVSDKENPFICGKFLSYATTDLFVEDDTAYIIFFPPAGGDMTSLYIIDVFLKENPKFVDNILYPSGISNSIFIEGDYIYIAGDDILILKK